MMSNIFVTINKNTEKKLLIQYIILLLGILTHSEQASTQAGITKKNKNKNLRI